MREGILLTEGGPWDRAFRRGGAKTLWAWIILSSFPLHTAAATRIISLRYEPNTVLPASRTSNGSPLPPEVATITWAHSPQTFWPPIPLFPSVGCGCFPMFPRHNQVHFYPTPCFHIKKHLGNLESGTPLVYHSDTQLGGGWTLSPFC